MNKAEFLEVLRNSLTNEITAHEIENHIEFYNEYIAREGLNKGEDTVINELGDPRLIAKTLIETSQFPHGSKHKNKGQVIDDIYDETFENTNKANNSNSKFRTINNWYRNIVLVLLFVVIITMVLFLGRIVISVLFNFGLPILLIIMAIKLISNLFRADKR